MNELSPQKSIRASPSAFHNKNSKETWNRLEHPEINEIQEVTSKIMPTTSRTNSGCLKLGSRPNVLYHCFYFGLTRVLVRAHIFFFKKEYIENWEGREKKKKLPLFTKKFPETERLHAKVIIWLDTGLF